MVRLIESAEFESQNRCHAYYVIKKYKRLKIASPGSQSKNLKFSTIFSYLNSADKMRNASKLDK